MKNLFFILLVGGMLACKDKNFDMPKSKGFMNTTANNEIWFDEKQYTVQIGAIKLENLANAYPCWKGIGRIRMEAFTKPLGGSYASVSLNFPFKEGVYTLTKSDGRDPCQNLQVAGDVFYTNYDVLLAVYELSDSEENKVEITKLNQYELRGNFTLHYNRVHWGDIAKPFPEKLTLHCSDFIAVR